MDYVVTVCDDAREACPFVPALKCNLHHAFPDPSRVTEKDAAQLAAFRRTRDEIHRWVIRTFPE